MPAEGTYVIVSNHVGPNSFLRLDVPGRDDHEVVQLSNPHTRDPSQRWEIHRVIYNYYAIVNAHSRKALDVPGGLSTPGLTLQQYTWHGGLNRQWRFNRRAGADGPELPSPDTFQIVNRATGMALDVPNGASRDGVQIQQYPPHRIQTPLDGRNQRWILRPDA
jgi:hypothetical protein